MTRVHPLALSTLRVALTATACAALALSALSSARAAGGHDSHAAAAPAAPAGADKAAAHGAIPTEIVRIDRSKVERPSAPAAQLAAADPGAHGAHGPKADHGTMPAATPAGAPPSVEELRRRLQEKVNAVRAAQARAAATHAAAPRKAGHKASSAPAAGEHGEAAAGRGGHAAHWSYEGETGPAAWGALKPEFSLCANGTRQSPIDIRGGVRVDLEPIRFDYHPSGFSVVDNGHTVQANVAPGNTIQVSGRTFELVQFHFHRPSEERINGRNYPLVAHLVHKDLEGRLAVVAVLMDQGKAHPMVQLVWNSLPLQRNEPLASPVPVDMAQVLPEDRRYYTYMGSLTTPPCSEGVLWLVLKQPAAVSLEQIGVFTHLYPMNARPIQQASQRLIKESF
jgi:carbonic anhydrase